MKAGNVIGGGDWATDRLIPGWNFGPPESEAKPVQWIVKKQNVPVAAEKFEQEFARFLGVKYCSLVNSGSSAFRTTGDLVNTNQVMNNSFWLGVYPGMRKEMIEYILEKIKEIVI